MTRSPPTIFCVHLLVAEGLIHLDYLVREGQAGEAIPLRNVVKRGVAGDGNNSSDDGDSGYDDGPVFEIKQGLDRGNVSFYGNTLFEVPGENDGRDSRNSPSLEAGGSINGRPNEVFNPLSVTRRELARDSMPYHPAPRFTASGREAFFGRSRGGGSSDRYAVLADGPSHAEKQNAHREQRSGGSFSDSGPVGNAEENTDFVIHHGRVRNTSDTSRVLNAVRLSLMALAAGNSPSAEGAGRSRSSRMGDAW